MYLTFDQIHTYVQKRHPDQYIPAKDVICIRCGLTGEKHASCSWWLTGNGGFNCHSCGSKGSLLQFEMEFSKCDYQTAMKNVAAITGASLNGGGRQHVATYFYRDFNRIPGHKKDRCRDANGDKSFTWSHCDDAGRWQPGGMPHLLYNAPEVVIANMCLLSEGERCTDLLNKNAPHLWPERTDVHVACTCNPEGAWAPGSKPKWRDEYSWLFSGKAVVIFADNDPSGRAWAEYVAQQIFPYATAVYLISFPDQREKYDIADWIEEHSGDPKLMIADLQRMIGSASLWKPAVQKDCAAANDPWAAEGMDTFLTDTEEEVAWLERDALAPETLTQIYAPRGLGKSLLAAYWAVKLAAAGKRVLMLDRDNPRRTLKSRLRSLGADDLGEQKANLKVISRERCPPLTRPDEWAAFPYADYDVVIVDSLDAMAEGIGEQDSAKPAKALAPLLDICHRENGPAVLLLGNTIKSAEHSRGSGVVEDRADIVFEVRDATEFRPSGDKPWIEELPAQGASEWAARSSRRKGRTQFRLALVATKFRLGEEPAPRMMEIDLRDEPWTVRDVTAEIDRAGEEARHEKAKQKADHHLQGVDLLRHEIQRRVTASELPILKKEAEKVLMSAKFKRAEAGAVIRDPAFRQVPGTGKGHPLELHLTAIKSLSPGEIDPLAKPNNDAGVRHPDFARPHGEHTGEKDPLEPRMDKGVFESAISPESSLYNPPFLDEKQPFPGVNGGVRDASGDDRNAQDVSNPDREGPVEDRVDWL
jgi:AAA domain